MRGKMGREKVREVAGSKLVAEPYKAWEFYSKYKGKQLEVSKVKYDLVNLEATLNGIVFLILELFIASIWNTIDFCVLILYPENHQHSPTRVVYLLQSMNQH